MSVRDNIAYPLKKRGVKGEARSQAVQRAADILQLGPLLDRKPKQLSGGQQQRVALGRALVREPKVFLLDEPLSNLDAKLRSYMRAELIELHRRIGKTMVYVTHDQLEAMTMAGRIAVMHNGRLQQFDTPETVYNRPANRFVAGFIGTPAMNQIEGEVAGDAFVMAGQRVPLDRARFVAGMADGPAVLGIRPEFIALGHGELPGTIRLVENTGHEQIVTVELPGGIRVLSRVEAGRRLGIGQQIPVHFEPDAIHLFETGEEGRRLNSDDDARVIPMRSRGEESR
jgi:ABC-type sugar transport system ATPase subunit